MTEKNTHAANDTVAPKIGLALSGGGSRAIAFHLGCLRALNRLGLLGRVEVLSTVSGGSVIGAYYHAHRGDFASFEAKIRVLLAQGLVTRMRRKLFTWLGLKVVSAFVVVGAIGITVASIKLFLKAVNLITPRSLAAHFERFDIRSPLRRFASRTTLLEVALDELLFREHRSTICRGSLILSSMRQNLGPAPPSASVPWSRDLGAGAGYTGTTCRSRMPSPRRRHIPSSSRPSTKS
jgi:predicted acylesterase/phospholipase RssA